VKFALSPHRAILKPRATPPSSPRQLPLSVLSIALTFMLVACHQATPPVAGPREVVVLPAQAGASGQRLSLPGDVQARFNTPMAFRIAGQVIERRVHLGEQVRRGDIVARLDAADTEQNLASAQADLEAARQHLDAAAKQSLRDTAQAGEQLISALQLEQTQDAYAAAQAQFKSAQARLAVAANQHHYTNLVAEHDGVISAEQANTGEVLAAGQPVFSLAWSGASDLITEAAESQVAQIKLGAPAVITLSALPKRHFEGKVREISPAADPQSRTFRIKVTIDSQDPALRLGMSGNVSIGSDADVATSIRIPATALFHQGDRPAVWIVHAGNGKVELRPITVSAYGEHSVAVSAGINAGEKIVVQGVHTLTAGESVKPIAPLHAEDFAL